jgi:GNAT superfamily N-acetyltransferase
MCEWQEVISGADKSCPGHCHDQQLGGPLDRRALYLCEYGAVTRWPLILRSASERDLGVIVCLIEDAAGWLRRTKNTDQWTRPWPNRTDRDSRILKDLSRGLTWIGWDGATPAATITTDPDRNPRWPEIWRNDPAVYVHRLVVGRPYAGVGLGAELLDWADRTGRRDHGAIWIRVNLWTTNQPLHGYYLRQGFEFCGLCADDGYPSAAMFQRPADRMGATSCGLFTEAPGGG